MRISDWSSDVCSSDLLVEHQAALRVDAGKHHLDGEQEARQLAAGGDAAERAGRAARIGRHLEGDAVEAVGRPGVFVEAIQRGAKEGAQIGRASSRERVCQYV